MSVEKSAFVLPKRKFRRHEYRTPGDWVFDIAIYLIGILVFIIILYPLYFVVLASFSDPGMVMTGKIWFIPQGFTLAGYEALMKESKIWTGFGNSMFYTLVSTVLSMLITIPAAYALSRADFKARRPVMLYFIFTMFFNGGLIPTYLTIAKTLNMDNSIWAMIVPFCLNVYNLIIMRSYFEFSLPKELWEVAQIDGCSNTRFLVTIAVPLSRAVLSVVMLYYVVAKWNEFFMALIFIRNPKLMPLQIVLRDILLQNQAVTTNMMDVGSFEALRKANLIKYTSIVVGTLPMLILYPFMQKYFEKGVMLGAIKG
jgi:putative aldouronate transport system permease protein